MSRLRRIRARWIFAALVGANLLLLAQAATRYREQRTLHRLVLRGTIESYTEAVERAPEARDRLLYNLGNLYLDRARKLREPGPARAAIAYYREALRLRPELLPAKKNYEVAARFLESMIPPRPPREPRPPDRVAPSEMPLTPNQI